MEDKFQDKAQMNTNTFERGMLPSLIKRFEITNLHGYRTLSLESPHSTTILIAQNGAGKTTLINALDAFLRGQFLRLKHLRFSEIRCQFTNQLEELVVTFEDVQGLTNASIDPEITLFAKRIQVEAQALINFLSNTFGILRSEFDTISDDPIYEAGFRTLDYNRKGTIDFFEKLQSLVFAHNRNLTQTITAVRAALKEYEVLYLPTFRRIESPLLTKEDDRYRRRRSRFKIPFSVFSGDIQFGLSDISDRLSDLNQEVVFESNRGYRKLSADIIKELLDGSFDRAEISDFYLPSSEELNVFFSRIKEGRRVGPYQDFVIPDIDHLLNANHLSSDTNRFLLYFISKLNSVMQTTRDVESRVEEFVQICNKYLHNSIDPVTASYDAVNVGQDIKELRLNRSTLSVYAVSLPSERKITLDALSSGEKQMISLFAKLYLYPKQKIILIDEPELSLSIDWQKQILEDVVNAPTCTQLVAITHSPFVFDNPLEPFARSLKVRVDSTRIPELDLGDDHDGELNL